MRSYWPLILLLASIWGASYLFIKVAVEDVEPAPMMAVRTLLAGVVLLGYLVTTLGASRALRELRAAWRPAAVLGASNAALPFWLIAWGEKHIDSSVAGIAQATVPIFTFVLAARFLPAEHVGKARLAGIRRPEGPLRLPESAPLGFDGFEIVAVHSRPPDAEGTIIVQGPPPG